MCFLKRLLFQILAVGVLFLSFSCGNPADNRKAEIETLVMQMDRGLNASRCEALSSLYAYGKDAIPYLIEKIDEPRKEGYSLKNPSVKMDVQGEEKIFFKNIGVLYAYGIEFLLLDNDPKSFSCLSGSIVPSTANDTVSYYGMIGLGEEGGKRWNPIVEEDTLKLLSKEDIKTIKETYKRWFDRNERNPINRMRSDYSRRIDYPLKGSGYYWY